MGDWHQTCALTHLPILGNDCIAVLPIIANENHSGLGEGDGYSSPFSLYSVFSPVFFGYYDDIGGIRSSKNGNFESSYFELLDRSGKLEKLSKEEYQAPHGYAEFVRQIGEGAYTDISLVCFHEKAFQVATEKIRLRKAFCQGNRISYQAWVQANLSFIRIQRDEDDLMGNNLYTVLSEIRDLHERDAFLEFAKDSTFSYQVVQTILLCKALSLSRFLLMPSMGAGHQSEEYSILKGLSEFVLEKCENRLKIGRDLEQNIFVS